MRKGKGGGEEGKGKGKSSRKCGVVSYVNVFAAVYVFTFNATSNSVALTPGKGKPAPPTAPPAFPPPRTSPAAPGSTELQPTTTAQRKC